MTHASIALAGLTSLLFAWRAQRDRRVLPVALGLGLIVAIDIVRLAPLPVRLDAALYLAHPCITAALVLRTLAPHVDWQGPLHSWMVLAGVVLLAPEPRLWWGAMPAAAWAVAVGLSVLAVASWARRRARAGRAELAALILAASDIAALGCLVTGGRPAGVAHVAALACWAALLGVALWPR